MNMKLPSPEIRGPFWILFLAAWSLILISHLPKAVAMGWLSVASVGTVPIHPQECTALKSKGLNRPQYKVCRKKVDHMRSVGEGASIAIQECQYQFKYRRWNCSTVNPDDIKVSGTREAGFLHAIASAGVSHTVTKHCAAGLLDDCGCDMSLTTKDNKHLGFRWVGCNDNIHYGMAFSREFVDAYERKKAQPLEIQFMNLHNNEAGRIIIQKHMRIQCKCHGVSGSCEMKTCWRVMPQFREVGDLLKEKFDGATEVKLQRRSGRRFLAPVDPLFKPQTPEDLVYLVKSPNFCDSNAELGTLGTQGRICNRTSEGIDGCDLLCCHRGYQTQIHKYKDDRCKCKFVWCCEVKCKPCQKEEEINTCL